jgi:DNA mismatch repair ATPase MutS
VVCQGNAYELFHFLQKSDSDVNILMHILCRTLYGQLNHCVTGFGKRLLKRWIARPLYDCSAILQRQSAIATFKVCVL